MNSTLVGLVRVVNCRAAIRRRANTIAKPTEWVSSSIIHTIVVYSEMAQEWSTQMSGHGNYSRAALLFGILLQCKYILDQGCGFAREVSSRLGVQTSESEHVRCHAPFPQGPIGSRLGYTSLDERSSQFINFFCLGRRSTRRGRLKIVLRTKYRAQGSYIRDEGTRIGRRTRHSLSAVK